MLGKVSFENVYRDSNASQQAFVELFNSTFTGWFFLQVTRSIDTGGGYDNPWFSAGLHLLNIATYESHKKQIHSSL